MKKLTDLSSDDARNFMLKESSYINFDLPYYFSFQSLLDQVHDELGTSKLSDYKAANPRDLDNINYQLFTNKDGKYAWRPFQIIHPVLYVSLVHKITEEEHWRTIKERFLTFRSLPNIECHSLPVVSESEDITDTESQIYTWWQLIEQRSIALSLDYRYLLQTDITDCYGSIYTHSISWALHTKEEAKKRNNRNNGDYIGVLIDWHLQDMSNGQTNGIPQGSTVMDFIAEIVLGYADLFLNERIEQIGITDYKILRYRDDYRIFSNNSSEADHIAKLLSEVLSGLGLKLNPSKTEMSLNIIESSIKPDKLHWISYKRKTENKQKWLIQLYMLADQFPNSGTLDTQLKRFLKIIQKSGRNDPNIPTLVGLVVELAYRNPRVFQSALLILTCLLDQLEDNDLKLSLAKKIKNRFTELPNSAYLKVWLQRLLIKLDDSFTYSEPICNKVLDPDVLIWESGWLRGRLKELVDQSSIVDYETLEELGKTPTEKEVKAVIETHAYDYAS